MIRKLKKNLPQKQFDEMIMQKKLDEWEIVSRRSEDEAHHQEIYNADYN